MRHFYTFRATVCAFLIVSINSGPALAANRPGYEEAYGMAGCGLGSIAAKEFSWDNGFVQVSASTTNGSYGNQTISMTIGISNCDDGLLTKELQSEQEVFVGANFAQLSKDAARGEGEYIRAFADLLGCSDSSEDSEVFIALGRVNHASIFSESAPGVVLTKYKAAIVAADLKCARA